MALFPNTHPINTLTEQTTFHAFAARTPLMPLMPFWKITDLVVLHDRLQPSASGGWFAAPPASTFSVSGYTMVNNPGQPPLQDPERTINIERTTRIDKYARCTEAPTTSSLGPSSPVFPGFRSVTVVGPDGRDPREAFPPRGPTAGGPVTYPPFRIAPGIPPGTIGPRP